MIEKITNWTTSHIEIEYKSENVFVQYNAF